MKATYRILAALLSLLCVSPLLAQEGGGTSGAEFLLSPPGTRLDAMGGVLDGLGSDLEGVLVNPAVLAGIQDVGLQVHFVPLPNEVTNAQAAFGIPLLGGLGVISGQLFNAGTFTYVNDLAQPVETVNIFDVAGGVSFSRYLWKSISLGATTKAIVRSLGTEFPFALAGDLGAAARFETPYIGQPPKPPTRTQLEREYQREKNALDKQKERKVSEASVEAVKAKDKVSSAEAALAAIDQKIEAAAAKQQAAEKPAADDKSAELQANRDAAAQELVELQAALAAAEEAKRGTLEQIESWYAGELAAAQSRLEAKMTDLVWVEAERSRLFEVIWNADKELTDADVDGNVDDIIGKTRVYVEDRRTALTEANLQAAERDRLRVESVGVVADGYRKQLEEEVGPASTQLQGELDTLNARKAEIEASQTEENKDQVKKDLAQVQAQIALKERELAGVESDPWVKRLKDRIAAKEKEIADIQAAVTLAAQTTEKTIAGIVASAEADIKQFEDLRASLKRDLTKAKLKRQLDTLDARNDRMREKAQRDYKAKEERLYTLLLSSMYRHEERILQSRLSSISQDSLARKAALEQGISKERESADDNFAFQQRLLGRQISDEEKKIKDAQTAGGTADEEALKARKAELSQLEADYMKATQELERRRADFDSEEKSRVSVENAQVRYERNKTRLVYLQQKDPYLNTSFAVSVRNLGTAIHVGSEVYPMPMMVSASLGYAVMYLEDHALKLSAQVDVPFADLPTVGIGLEYGFADTIFVRAGYSFGSIERTFSAGLGLKLALGFTQYSVDYTFRPLPDYGFVHSIGISIQF